MECNFDRRHLRCQATALDLVNVGIFDAVHAPSGLGLVPDICLLPAQNKPRGDHSVALFFPDHVRLCRVYGRHRLETKHSLLLGFDCSPELRALLGRKMSPQYLVGIPTAEIEFSLQWARLSRCNRESFVFLALTAPPLPSQWSSFFLVLSVPIVRCDCAASSSGSLLKVPLLSCPSRVALHSIACGTALVEGGSDGLGLAGRRLASIRAR